MLLDVEVRPTVVFDPARKEHRAHYAEFIRTGTWGKCPVKFAVRDWPSLNLAAAIQRQLVEYYITQEFKIKAVDAS